MANIPLKSIKFPDLADTYTVPSNAGELPYNKSATYPADTVGKALQDKPDADGTIANAEQLTSNIYEEDNTPYNFRTSGGSIDIGDRETDMLVGGTVAWNQLAPSLTYDNGWRANTNYGEAVFNNGEVTYTITTQNASQSINRSNGNGGIPLIKGHKYFVSVDTIITEQVGNKAFRIQVMDSQWVAASNIQANTKTTVASVFESANETGGNAYFGVFPNISTGVSVGAVVKTSNIIVIDLTALFGSTIADYIYSLEQANAGEGVAWFKKLFPKPYYAYNAGELMSVNAVSHDMVGFNQFDASDSAHWENWSIGSGTLNSGTAYKSAVIPCIPNTKYYASKTKGVRIYLASFPTYPSAGDTATVYEGNNTGLTTNLTTGANDHYLVVWFYNGNIDSSIGAQAIADTLCVNISWDGERDGEYEAYVKHSYPLDNSLTLRGIPKLDASNNLYYDGDTYASDGTVTRRYGKMAVPSSVSYMSSILEGTNTVRVSIGNSAIGMMPHNDNTQCMIADFPTYLPDVMYSPNNDFEGISTNKHATNQVIWLRIAKTKLSAYTYQGISDYLQAHPITMVYELATPTTEAADPYTNPQIVNDFGTEEYVDYPYSQGTRDVGIPVGHQTQYMANLKAKLEMSPNSPEGAGDYIVRQTNDENEYVTLASNATIQNIIARLEALENA